MKKKTTTVYYKDELHDDFANNGIETKKLNENYQYIMKNPFNRFFSNLVRILLLPIVKLLVLILYHPKYVNKKQVISKVKKGPYFIYSNHVLPLDPLIPPSINSSKLCLIAASADTFSMNKVLSWLVRALGAFPVPNSPKMYYNYVDFIHYEVERKHRVLMYPEAHIWPYCNFIRHFTSTSFKYPVYDNVPIITMTTCFTKKKYGKKPKLTIYFDGPFYPDQNMKQVDAIENLKDQAFNAMQNRAKKYSTYEYIKYEKSQL